MQNRMIAKTIGLTFFLLISTIPIGNTSASSSIVVDASGQTNGTIIDIYGVRDSKFLFVNTSSVMLFDVKNETVLDSVPCTGFVRVNSDSSIVMCQESIYEIGDFGLSVLHNGPINRLATPSSNLTAVISGNGYQNSPNCLRGSGGSLEIFNGTNKISEVSLHSPTNSGDARTYFCLLYTSPSPRD